MDTTTSTENYLRLHLLEIKGATPVLRYLFLKQVNNSSCRGNVDEFLDYFKDDIKIAKSTTSDEYQILFPSNGSTDINKWDISLLAYILIHCCTIDGQLSLKGKNNPKEILKKEVKNEAYTDLDQFLSSKRNHEIIAKMKETHIITEEQYSILYPSNNEKTKLNTWGIELLICVLFKLCQGDNIERLRAICKKVITRQVKLCNTSIDLHVFLRKHATTFDEIRRQGQLTDSQYKQLFPSHDLSDVNNMDDNVLRVVILNACQALSKSIPDEVQKIRKLRKTIGAHPANAEVDNDMFREMWTNLHLAINTIINIEVPSIKDEIERSTRTVTCGPLDIPLSIAILKECYINHDKKHTAILAKLKAMESGIATVSQMVRSGFASADLAIHQSEAHISQKVDANSQDIQELKKALYDLRVRLPVSGYIERREIKCFDVIFVVSGNSKESVDRVEQNLMKAMENIKDSDTEKIKEFTDRIKELFLKDGTTVVEIRRGSVVLVVKCLSVRGLHQLIKLIYSTELKEYLNEIAAVFAKQVGCPIRLAAYIPRSSLQTVLEELRNIDSCCGLNDYRGCVKMRLKATSVKEMAHILQMSQEREITTNLQRLSDRLSFEFNQKINVSIVLQPEQFKTALQSADSTIVPYKSQPLKSKQSMLRGELAELEDVCEENMSSWYHGPLSRRASEDLLSSERNGSFLVRENEQNGRRFISVRSGEIFYHYKILQDSEGKVYMALDQKFNTLAELVGFYSSHSAGLMTPLQFLVPKIIPNVFEVRSEPDILVTKCEETMRILLLGHTGHGKSSTGNTILGKNVFKAELNSGPVTKLSQYAESVRFGRRVLVVDTPGLFDTELTQQEIQRELLKTLTNENPGFHAIALVLQPERFAEELQETIDLICKWFGVGVERKLLLILTHTKNQDNIASFFQNKPVHLLELKRKCGNTVVPFENEAEFNEKDKQVHYLFECIDQNVSANGGTYFENAMYKLATLYVKHKFPREVSMQSLEFLNAAGLSERQLEEEWALTIHKNNKEEIQRHIPRSNESGVYNDNGDETDDVTDGGFKMVAQENLDTKDKLSEKDICTGKRASVCAVS